MKTLLISVFRNSVCVYVSAAGSCSNVHRVIVGINMSGIGLLLFFALLCGNLHNSREMETAESFTIKENQAKPFINIDDLLHEERPKQDFFALDTNGRERTSKDEKFDLEGTPVKRLFRLLGKRIRRSISSSNNITNATKTVLQWQEWSDCKAESCNENGTQRRVRRCFVGRAETTDETLCGTVLSEIQPCTMQCSDDQQEVNASWSEWTEWTDCSVTCGDGEGRQTRRRECLASSVVQCIGSIVETRICNAPVTCPAWDEWSAWSTCSRTCGGGGIRIRGRHCVGIEVTNGNLTEQLKQSVQVPLQPSHRIAMPVTQCPGGEEVAEESEYCLVQRNCERRWSRWSAWSKCSVTCGIGHSERNRKCSGDSSDGPECDGNRIQNKRCYRPPCWTAWSKYTKCSVSCGMQQKGFRVRRRRCLGTSNYRPVYRRCPGNNVQRQTCNSEPCPLWGSWRQINQCSRTCNGGIILLRRDCIRGRCAGRSVQRRSCGYGRCPEWSPWSAFSCCSVTCGEDGWKERSRSCRLFSFRRGQTCAGGSRQREPCSRHPCNVTLPSVFDSFHCGIRNVINTSRNGLPVLRIFGGQASKKYGWPWQSSLQHRVCKNCQWLHLCGTTLVAPKWVATAAHCIRESSYRINIRRPGDSWSVVLGMQRLYEDGERFFIHRVFIHPDYKFRFVTESDIGLIKLQRDATLSRAISPVCLPHAIQPRPGQSCTITGWGYTGPSSSGTTPRLSRNLLEASIPIMSFEQCQKVGPFYRDYLNRREHMCAGDPVTASRDSCMGDSGGPLVCRREENQWYFAGVTSFGFHECGTRGHVGVYAPMKTFEQWLRDTVENYNDINC